MRYLYHMAETPRIGPDMSSLSHLTMIIPTHEEIYDGALSVVFVALLYNPLCLLHPHLNLLLSLKP